MLIRQAELDFGARIADLRIRDGRVSEIASRLSRRPGEEVVEAGGAALLPSLHDHHIHLYALAAAQASVHCGPPQVASAHALAAALRSADASLEANVWLRGIGFHESVVTGSGIALDRDWLDRVLPQRPVRIQHRSGRLWLLNSAALSQIGMDETTSGDDPLERIDGRITGRLYDADDWLRRRTAGQRPSLAGISRQLWDWGVTAVTDTSHGNGLADYAAFAAAQASGELLQDVQVMGNAELDAVTDQQHEGRCLWRGAHKFHLHTHDLPDFDSLCADIRRAHAAHRNAAFHCTTRSELVYALAALREVGVRPGDRIEHASITPPEPLAEIAALKLTVVTQPGFIAERGDDYLRDVELQDQPWLYRLRSFVDAGVPLALSSDAPYTQANPWLTVAAATTRRTAAGAVIGADERMTPEQALQCLGADLRAPGGSSRRIGINLAADLCLLPRPWQAARADLAKMHAVRTWRAGETSPRA